MIRPNHPAIIVGAAIIEGVIIAYSLVALIMTVVLWRTS